jgi:phage terminase large subunit-like protein
MCESTLIAELRTTLTRCVARLPTTILLLHKPETIATSAFVLACAQLRINIPSYPEEEDEDMIEEGEEREEKPYWLEVFDVQPSEVQSTYIRHVSEISPNRTELFRLLGTDDRRVSTCEERMGQKWNGDCASPFPFQ